MPLTRSGQQVIEPDRSQRHRCPRVITSLTARRVK
jgi:hypothetical protein